MEKYPVNLISVISVEKRSSKVKRVSGSISEERASQFRGSRKNRSWRTRLTVFPPFTQRVFKVSSRFRDVNELLSEKECPGRNCGKYPKKPATLALTEAAPKVGMHFRPHRNSSRSANRNSPGDSRFGSLLTLCYTFCARVKYKCVFACRRQKKKREKEERKKRERREKERDRVEKRRRE